jgi:hypothetical protein
MGLAYYVYYRVAPGRRAVALERAAALLERVARETEVHGRLVTRCGEPELFMEIYEHVPAGQPFAVTLERAARDLDLAGVLAPGATRALECFDRACA